VAVANVIPEAARWRGKPDRERTRWLKEHHRVDQRGILGRGWGAMFKKKIDGDWHHYQTQLHPQSETAKLRRAPSYTGL
jgi:hypothetical protein